jgi:hypothetical protein
MLRGHRPSDWLAGCRPLSTYILLRTLCDQLDCWGINLVLASIILFAYVDLPDGANVQSMFGNLRGVPLVPSSDGRLRYAVIVGGGAP